MQKPLLNCFLSRKRVVCIIRLKMLFATVDDDKILENYKLFNKTKADVDDDVAIITKWFETQPHLPEIMGMIL